MIFLGIDLGLTGALACLDAEGKLLWLHDMPTTTIRIGKRQRGAYDVARLWTLFSRPIQNNVQADVVLVVEDIYHLGFRGALAARAAGIGWGMVTLYSQVSGWPLLAVAPRQWQRVMLAGRAKGKGASRARAAELFPWADLGGRKDEGRAEALLLAEYGRRQRA
jgi:crossover junction endodeoxyribonuclease RuvC